MIKEGRISKNNWITSAFTRLSYNPTYNCVHEHCSIEPFFQLRKFVGPKRIVFGSWDVLHDRIPVELCANYAIYGCLVRSKSLP